MKFLKKGWLVLTGDDGGQIYMTIPTTFLACASAKNLIRLLETIDFLQWSSNDGGAGAYFHCGCGNPQSCDEIGCGKKVSPVEWVGVRFLNQKSGFTQTFLNSASRSLINLRSLPV